MWTCPTCNELHSDRFDMCWNCSTDLDGRHHPSFERERPDDELTNGHVDVTDPAGHRLPDATYYCMPLFCLLFLLMLRQSEAWQSSDSSTNLGNSWIAIVICVAGAILIFAPLVAVVMRIGFYSLLRREPGPTGMRFFWGIIQLPDHIRRAHPWFAPIHYASPLLCVLTNVILTWQRL